MSNKAFPYLAVREIEIGLARVRAARVGYVGELGWELHTPAEQALHVYEMLRDAGEAYGIADAGYRAIETLRLEKGYVYWSSEVTPDTNPFEAGLDFAVALDKGDFIGRSALAAIKPKGPARRLITMTVDGFSPLIGGEALLADGKVIGTLCSGGYGYTVGKTIALAYIPADMPSAAALEIVAFGKRYAAARAPAAYMTRRVYASRGRRPHDCRERHCRRPQGPCRRRERMWRRCRPRAIRAPQRAHQSRFKVSWRSRNFCLRLPGAGTEVYINRAIERANAEAAAEAGVSPEVVYFGDDGVW